MDMQCVSKQQQLEFKALNILWISSICTHIVQVRICNMYALEICTKFFFSKWVEIAAKKMKSQNFSLHVLMHIHMGMEMKLCGMSQIQNGTNES